MTADLSDHQKFRKLAAVLIIATICAFGIYTTMIAVLVNPYIQYHTWSQISRDLDTYRNLTQRNPPPIYFIGNSQVIHDVDPDTVRNALAGNNRSYKVFNLGVDDDTPLQRLIELRDIIEAKPALVLIGYSYTSFSNQTRYIPDDNLALLSGKIIMDDHSRSLYTRDQLALISQTPIEQLIFKRKFIIPAMRSSLGIHLRERDDIINDTMSFEMKKIIADNPYDAFLAPVYEEDNLQKQAFLHIENRLREHNIPVIFINMPLDPLRSATIPESTRTNFFAFLNSTGCEAFDFEGNYAGYDFHDLVHMNRYGREKFSQDIAVVISSEVGDNAV